MKYCPALNNHHHVWFVSTVFVFLNANEELLNNLGMTHNTIIFIDFFAIVWPLSRTSTLKLYNLLHLHKPNDNTNRCYFARKILHFCVTVFE